MLCKFVYKLAVENRILLQQCCYFDRLHSLPFLLFLLQCFTFIKRNDQSSLFALLNFGVYRHFAAFHAAFLTANLSFLESNSVSDSLDDLPEMFALL
jgi:hypothetical protein